MEMKMSSARRKSVLAVNYGNSSNWEVSTMRYRSLICGTVVLAVLTLSAVPATATLLSVDMGTGDTQSGFNAMASSPVMFSTAAGNITVSETGADGFYARPGPANFGAFTEGAFYQDFAYSNTPGGVIHFDISGITANTDYQMTWYCYDYVGPGNDGITNYGTATNSIIAHPGSNTTGSSGSVTWTASDSGAPTYNGECSYTGTWRSTSTSLDIDVAYLSGTLWPYTRVNGFEMTAAPEPSTLVLLGAGLSGCLLRLAEAAVGS